MLNLKWLLLKQFYGLFIRPEECLSWCFIEMLPVERSKIPACFKAKFLADFFNVSETII